MEDLEDKITKIVDQYPDFAKEWIKDRLHKELGRTGQLPDGDTIRNIRDCLASLDDKSKTIQKLDKISFKDMNIIQEKWHKELANKADKLKEFGGKPFEYEPILKCDNGFQWVRLNSSEAKDYEGNAMGHCVGSGGYDDNKTTIFSLRDKDNIPHITVEYNERGKKIEQIQGKGNTEPNGKYYKDIQKLYQETGAINYDELIKNVSQAVLNGKILLGADAILACPPGTVFDSVNLGKDSKITEWNYSVSGDFNACSYNLEYVNPNCEFGGNVDIRKTSIKEWHCDVGGDFDASGIRLEYVNPKCKFGGSVNVRGTRIKEWHCDVGGDFNASGSKLEYVNPKCKFGGSVNLKEARFLKEWHNDVPGDFDARESILEYVHPKCKFGGSVNVTKTNIKEWHNDVPSRFIAEWSKLEYVNPKCKFSGFVNISNTNIKEWHCDVGGDFYACEFGLESVNPNCVFGGDVDISYTKITEWHNDVGGNFHYVGSNLEKIVNCEIKGDLNAQGSNLEKIVNCEIEGKIYCNDNVEIINEEKQTMKM